MLPLLVLIVSFLFGYARLRRALFFFIAWSFACTTLYIASTIYFVSHLEHPPGLAIVGVVVSMLLAISGPWLATLFSIATSRRMEPAPVGRAYGAYQSLDEQQKTRLHDSLKTGLGLAVKHGSRFLRSKGHSASADALEDVANVLH